MNIIYKNIKYYIFWAYCYDLRSGSAMCMVLKQKFLDFIFLLYYNTQCSLL